jgi:hypothetical protein
MNWSLRLPSAAPDTEAPNDRGETRAPQLAALLSCCVILWFYVLRSVGLASSNRGGGLGFILSDALLTFPLAFVAVKVSMWSARRWGTARQSMPELFARAALIAGMLALFLAVASGAHQFLDRTFGAVPIHLFHGQSRGSEGGRVGDFISTGLLDAFLGYLVALPLVFLGLASLRGKNRDGRTRPSAVHSGPCSLSARSLVPIAVASALVGGGIGASAFTLSKRVHRNAQAVQDHAQMVTRVSVETGFEVNDLRVTVQAAQWVRQPRSAAVAGPIPAKTESNPDRIYLEVRFENTGALPRSVGRGEFRMRASDGATWAPLADDFPEILLSPAETLATRLVFEVPPQAGQLAFVPTAGAAEAQIPIGDDSVGGIFGALCRALSKPWGS